jgi:TetR/AcrR family transcriptional regulator, repressor for uid operon
MSFIAEEGVARADVQAPASADDTARRLVVAAAEVFAEKGYDGAGVAEIARRAGLTTGAIYSRFKGKAELLAAAIQACAPDEIESLFAQHAFEGRAPDILQAVGMYLVTRPASGQPGLLLEAVVAARRDPEVAAVLKGALMARRALWAEIIDASKERGLLDPDVDTEALVHFAHAVGLGFLAYEAVGVGHPDPDAWQHLIAQLIASVTPAGAALQPPGRSS